MIEAKGTDFDVEHTLSDDYDTAVFRLVSPPVDEWKGICFRYMVVSIESPEENPESDDSGDIDATLHFNFEIVKGAKDENIQNNQEFCDYIGSILRLIIIEYVESLESEKTQ